MIVARVMGPRQRCVALSLTIVFCISSMFILDISPTKALTTAKILVVHPSPPATPAQPDAYHSSQAPSQLSQPAHHDEQSQQVALAACESKFDHLRDLRLSETIKYTKRCIKPKFLGGGNRDAVATMDSRLVGELETLSLQEACPIKTDELGCEHIELAVPPPPPPTHGQYAHLVFGVATTYSRLQESKHAFAHWLGGSGATLVALLTDPLEASASLDLSALEHDYALSGASLQLVNKHGPQDTTEQSHMLVLQDMLAAAPTAHWLGILDDDTFIPSLHALAATLALHDHNRPQYLGQLTEHAGLLQMGILGAFGGAGIFLSRALAHELQPHLDGCRSSSSEERRGGGGGDVQIMQCVHAHSAARLTRVEGLWQTDLMGDPAGFYESGRRLLSMHHWKSWNWLRAVDMAAVTRVCGECLLQRFVFVGGRDEKNSSSSSSSGTVAVLNNGYSINVYENGEGLPDLSRTELTWDNYGDGNAWMNYEWSLGPFRPRVETKKSYVLAAAYEGEENTLVQVYLRRGDNEGTEDEVVELVWQPWG